MGFASDLLPFGLLGILGAAHCAGMCGGFAVGIGSTGDRAPRRFLQRQLTYVLGKALTYAVLGLLLATGGHAIAHAGADLALVPAPGDTITWIRNLSSWVAGLAMIAFGLRLLGVPVFREAWIPPASMGRVRTFLRTAISLPGYGGALSTGLVTGLLPCGLSWSAFALAAGRSPVVAFSGLLVFGLSTAPALLLTAWGWRGLRHRYRTLATRLAGPLLLLFGAVTLVRGGAAPAADELMPDCCQTAASAP